jgi:hypothetical protein
MWISLTNMRDSAHNLVLRSIVWKLTTISVREWFGVYLKPVYTHK